MFLSAKRILNPGLAAATVDCRAVLDLHALGARRRERRSQDRQVRRLRFDLCADDAAGGRQRRQRDRKLLARRAMTISHKRKAYETLFKSLSNEIVGVDLKDALAAEAARRKFPGLLGDELSNITFAGELRAAEATLKTWAAYVGIDGQTARLAERRQARRRDRARHRRQARPIELGVRSVPEGAAADDQDQPGRFRRRDRELRERGSISPSMARCSSPGSSPPPRRGTASASACANTSSDDVVGLRGRRATLPSSPENGASASPRSRAISPTSTIRKPACG